MLEQKICDHCKNADIPLTETNGLEIFQRDSGGKKVVRAVVHQTCADAWALAHSGTLILDVQPDVQPAPGILNEGMPTVPQPASMPSGLPEKVGHWKHPEEG